MVLADRPRESRPLVGALVGAAAVAVTGLLATTLLILAPAVRVEQAAAVGADLAGAIGQPTAHAAAHASRAGAPGVQVEVALDGPALADVPPGGHPTAGYAFGQCTWWAAFNRRVPGDMGNGDQWVASAAARGLPVSGQPVVGAIVGYRAGAWGDLGHVAAVIAVGQGYFDVSEMNVIATEQGSGRLDERRNRWPDPEVQGFIL